MAPSTDSLPNKKTYATTDMGLSNLEIVEFGERDPIPNYVNIIIENPVLSNLYFQMLIFYNFFYSFLHLFLLFTILIYKLWIFRTREYKEYIAFALIIFYLPLELVSLYFAYKGNINETVRFCYVTYIVS
jgi:hypothetical protein